MHTQLATWRNPLDYTPIHPGTWGIKARFRCNKSLLTCPLSSSWSIHSQEHSHMQSRGAGISDRTRKTAPSLRITRASALMFWVSLCFPYLEKHQIKRMWLKTTKREREKPCRFTGLRTRPWRCTAPSRRFTFMWEWKFSASSRSAICFYWLVSVWIIYCNNLTFISLTFGLAPKTWQIFRIFEWNSRM